MEPSVWQELFDYNFWANWRVWELVMALDERLFDQELGGDRRSLRQQCIHILAVEYWWLHFLDTGVVEFIDDEEQLLTRAGVRSVWDEVEAMIRGYLSRLTPSDSTARCVPIFGTIRGRCNYGRG